MGWYVNCINCGEDVKVNIEEIHGRIIIHAECSECKSSETIKVPKDVNINEIIEERMGGYEW